MKNKKKHQLSFTTYEVSTKIKKDDPLQIIFTTIDWSFISTLLKDKYLPKKELTYEPESLFRAQLLIWLGEAKSNRNLAETLRFNARYCLLCGFDNFLKTPAHSTFSYFRKRIGKDLYYKILHRIIAQAVVVAYINQINISSNIAHIVVYSGSGKKKSCNCSGKRCKFTSAKEKSSEETAIKFTTKNFNTFGYKVKLIIRADNQLPQEIYLTTVE
ncbi:MAG: hypothetical protein Kow00103_03830 [Candidatus Caldatribacteriota bacterium]